MAWKYEKFKHDAAIYAICPNCGFAYDCSSFNLEKGSQITKVYNFCPECGMYHYDDSTEVGVTWCERTIEEFYEERMVEMPIKNEGENVYIGYKIPENIKELITDEFLKEFRNRLFRICGYSLEDFAETGISMCTSTSGWYVAFWKACKLTNNSQLLNYYNTLDWYDSDLFDDELAHMLIEKKLILGDLSEIIEEKLGIKEEDLRVCNDCRKYFSKDMVVKINEDEEEDGIWFSKYRCLHCQDVKDTKDKNKNATDYYRNILSEIEKEEENE